MIRVKYIDASGVLKVLSELQKRVGIPAKGLGDLAELVRGRAEALIIPNIKRRFGESGVYGEHTRSDWRSDPSYGFHRDPQHFDVDKVDAIKEEIDTNNPKKLGHMVYLGIGNIKKLDEAARLSQEEPSKYSLFQILEFGTGLFTSYQPEWPGGHSIERGIITRFSKGDKRMRFPYRPPAAPAGREWTPVSVDKTESEGQIGRNAFLTLAGTVYSEDLSLLKDVANHIITWTHKLSYGG